MRDLIALVADADIEFTLRGLLERNLALSIRGIDCELRRHPQRDAGCRTKSVEYLRDSSRSFRHAFVVFDRDGCGAEGLSRTAIETQLETELAASGWARRCAAICIEPELESWVWSNSPHVASQLAWSSPDGATLPQWLLARGWAPEAGAKPVRPKEAMLAALGRPRSADIYRELARRVSLNRCTDPAFTKLRESLSAWFPTGA
jgi:hypothetical protein